MTQSSIGVGGPSDHFDLSDSRDLIIPFDYYSTGKSTELLCYRPGTGTCWVLKNTALVGATPNFISVYKTSSGIGINGVIFDLSDSRDLIFPFDLNGTGLKDGIVCFRPGTGIVYNFKHDINNGFNVRFYSNIGILHTGVFPKGLRYNLSSNADRIIPYDYSSNGQTNNVLCYRPGAGACYIFTAYYGEGNCVYHTGSGIGSGSTFYDLQGSTDKVFAYDCDGSGKIDHLVAYRPGLGAFWVFNNSLGKIY